MEDEALNDIMGYLGLGPKPKVAQPGHVKADGIADAIAANEDQREVLLASTKQGTLWVTGNETAKWIELRGSFPTLRATRSKAQLLITAKADIVLWADGEAPSRKKDSELILATRRYNGLAVLEIRYRGWKPLRLTRDQARAFLEFLEHIAAFANR